MPDPKIEAVERLYEAYGRVDLEAVLAEVADGVEWAAEAASTSVPWYGPHKGKGEVSTVLRGDRLEHRGHRVHAAVVHVERDRRDRRRALGLHRALDRQARGDDHAALVAVRRREDRHLPRLRGHRAVGGRLLVVTARRGYARRMPKDRIPGILCIDCEPDEPFWPVDRPSAWSGFALGWRTDRVPSVTDSSRRPASPRCSRGRCAWIRRSRRRTARRRTCPSGSGLLRIDRPIGDSTGVHPHTRGRDEQHAAWVNDHEDASWTSTVWDGVRVVPGSVRPHAAVPPLRERVHVDGPHERGAGNGLGVRPDARAR